MLFHRYLPEPAEGVPIELPSGQHLGIKVLSEQWPRRDPRRSERTLGEHVLRKKGCICAESNPHKGQQSSKMAKPSAKWPVPVHRPTLGMGAGSSVLPNTQVIQLQTQPRSPVHP